VGKEFEEAKVNCNKKPQHQFNLLPLDGNRWVWRPLGARIALGLKKKKQKELEGCGLQFDIDKWMKVF